MDQKSKRTPTGNYSVGYALPPKESRFSKGKSGNPEGRPRVEKQMSPEQVNKLLSAGVPVQKNGATVKMPPLEVELRKLVQKALQDKDMRAIERLLKKFKKYGLLPETQQPKGGGVVTLPSSKQIPSAMSKLLITTYGAPPWSVEEIEAIRPAYEKEEAEYWAMKKETLRGIYLSMKRGRHGA